MLPEDLVEALAQAVGFDAYSTVVFDGTTLEHFRDEVATLHAELRSKAADEVGNPGDEPPGPADWRSARYAAWLRRHPWSAALSALSEGLEHACAVGGAVVFDGP